MSGAHPELLVPSRAVRKKQELVEHILGCVGHTPWVVGTTLELLRIHRNCWGPVEVLTPLALSQQLWMNTTSSGKVPTPLALSQRLWISPTSCG